MGVEIPDLDEVEKLELQTLRSQIEVANKAYYDASAPVKMSDEDYDLMIERLRTLSPNDVLLASVGSAPVAGNWSKKDHKIAMGSLNKAKGEEGITTWWEEVLYSLIS